MDDDWGYPYDETETTWKLERVVFLGIQWEGLYIFIKGVISTYKLVHVEDCEFC